MEQNQKMVMEQDEEDNEKGMQVVIDAAAEEEYEVEEDLDGAADVALHDEKGTAAWRDVQHRDQGV